MDRVSELKQTTLKTQFCQGYDTLQALVPTCQQTDASSHKEYSLLITNTNILYIKLVIYCLENSFFTSVLFQFKHYLVNWKIYNTYFVQLNSQITSKYLIRNLSMLQKMYSITCGFHGKSFCAKMRSICTGNWEICIEVSKAVVLQKSIDYLQYLSQQKKKQEADLATLRKVGNSLFMLS